MDTKKIFNEGLDFIGGAAINLLPVGGAVKNALEGGLDNLTDNIFDEKAGTQVPVLEHSEVKSVTDNLVKVVIGLVKNNVLRPIDLPFVEGANEELFEDGLCLQIEATIRQAIENAFQSKQ